MGYFITAVSTVTTSRKKLAERVLDAIPPGHELVTVVPTMLAYFADGPKRYEVVQADVITKPKPEPPLTIDQASYAKGYNDGFEAARNQYVPVPKDIEAQPPAARPSSDHDVR